MTFVLVGLRRSRNSLLKNVLTKSVRNLAFQALFLLRPAQELLRKFCSLGLPPLLFPTLQVGRIRGGSQGAPGVVSCEASSPPAWPRSSKRGGECLWTFVRCALVRLCLFSPFGSWGGGGCSVAAGYPCPRHFLGCISPLITARSTT